MSAETLVTPGFVDVHTHLREPSGNVAETIGNGTHAALRGGFVLVADMPNNPGNPTWIKERLDKKIELAEEAAHIPTAFYAGCQPEGNTIGELAAMAHDAIGLKLYGDPTTGSDLNYEADAFRDIVEEWHKVAPSKPVVFHSGKNNLEDMIGLVSYDLKHPLHIAHVNNPEQVSAVSEAKLADARVTCGVCPHHLLKTSHDRTTQGTFAEMMPPLADQHDAEKLLYMVNSGEIDIIETDYAPHLKEAKWQAELEGGHCFGVPGIEHVVPLLMYQVEQENLRYERLIEAFSSRPADLLGVRLGDETQVTWSTEKYRIENESEQVVSGAGWSPYLGMIALGRVLNVRVGSTWIMHGGSVIRKHPEVLSVRGHEFI